MRAFTAIPSDGIIDLYALMTNAIITKTESGFHLETTEITADLTAEDMMEIAYDTVTEWAQLGAI